MFLSGKVFFKTPFKSNFKTKTIKFVLGIQLANPLSISFIDPGIVIVQSAYLRTSTFEAEQKIHTPVTHTHITGSLFSPAYKGPHAKYVSNTWVLPCLIIVYLFGDIENQ